MQCFTGVSSTKQNQSMMNVAILSLLLCCSVFHHCDCMPRK